MIIDTSALLAILFNEPESDDLVHAIAIADTRHVPAPVVVEASAVLLARAGPGADVALDALLHRLDIDVIDMTTAAASAARDAYSRYGKGVGDPAVLNFGDCLAYGVAVAMNERLLYKGNDFAQTDVVSAS
ncbi:MAG: type II toxin-antitoxin system VapC family toxin [Gemmatimonadaceae bacterium]